MAAATAVLLLLLMVSCLQVPKAMQILESKGVSVCILKLNRIKPIPAKALDLAAEYKNIFFFEEGMATGGVGEHFLYDLVKREYKGEYKLTAIDDVYVKHAKVDSLLKKLGLDGKAQKLGETFDKVKNFLF